MIGGVVDRCVRKARTLSLAETHQIPSMRLPIQEYIPLRQTHILNVDAVFNIIARFQATGDWLETLSACVPLRTTEMGRKSKRKKSRVEQNNLNDGASGDVKPPRPLFDDDIIEPDRVCVGMNEDGDSDSSDDRIVQGEKSVVVSDSLVMNASLPETVNICLDSS